VTRDHSVVFGDALRPAVTDGDYRVRVTPRLTKSRSDSTRFDDPPYLPDVVEQRVEVVGPRWTILPQWVHGAYPPAGACGVHDDVLPHLTLERETLPWERELSGGNDRAPWLALLVFGAGELTGDPSCLGKTETMTVEDLLKRPGRPGIDDKTVHQEDKRLSVRTVTVAPATLYALLPRRTELGHLVHTREVKPEPGEVKDKTAQFAPGQYAVLMANRLPRSSGGRYAVHLVSLEGWEAYLSDTAPTFPSHGLTLVSLWSWTFESLPDTATGFADLRLRLMDPPGRGDPAELLLRPPVPDDAPATQPGDPDLADGYLPLPFTLESGARTFAWYRGPAVPVHPEREAEHFRSAVEALDLVDSQGVYDVSCAAAWNLGRGLALADAVFCAALLRLRGKARTVLQSLSSGLQPTDAESSRPSAELIDRLLDDQDKLFAGIYRTSGAASEATAEAPAHTPPPPIPRRRVAARRPLYAAMLRPEDVRDNAPLRRRLDHALRSLHGARRPAAPTEDGTDTGRGDEDYRLVGNWLRARWFWEGVPFHHLVPDERALPPESLRLFYVDPRWVHAMIRGALSVGLAHELDATVDEVLFGPEEITEPARRPVCGMVIRSRLVSGWPKLGVSASRGGKALAVHREQRGDQTLLCLFDGVPDDIGVSEPPQAVHFGVDRPTGFDPSKPLLGQAVIRTRRLDGPVGQDDGRQFPLDKSKGLMPYVRAGGPADNVLSVTKLAADLGAFFSLGRSTTSLEFAIQMTNSPQRRHLLAPAHQGETG
jgi:hypothetical protein